MVEASAAADTFVTRSNANFNESEAEVEPLQGFVVAIPTMNAIHGQDSWQGEHVSNEFADHSAWDVNEIVLMLRRFFAVSGAVSLPDLAEYEWRLDKVSRSFCFYWCLLHAAMSDVRQMFCICQFQLMWCT